MEPGTLQGNSTRLSFLVLLTGSCTYIHVYTHIYTYIGGVRVGVLYGELKVSFLVIRVEEFGLGLITNVLGKQRQHSASGGYGVRCNCLHIDSSPKP